MCAMIQKLRMKRESMWMRLSRRQAIVRLAAAREQSALRVLSVPQVETRGQKRSRNARRKGKIAHFRAQTVDSAAPRLSPKVLCRIGTVYIVFGSGSRQDGKKRIAAASASGPYR